MSLLTSIQAGSREIAHRLTYIALVEKNPVKALFECGSYSLVHDRLLKLGNNIKQLDGKKPLHQRMRAIWDELFRRGKRPALAQLLKGLAELEWLASNHSLTQSIPLKSPFAETDLVVFKKHYRGKLPPNGLFEGDYARIEKLLERIESGKTNLTISANPTERKKILHFIALLLTRETGRVLLFDLLGKKHRNKKIEITLGKSYYAQQLSDTSFKLELSMQKDILISEWPDGRRKSEKTPQWITLGHELTHLRHLFNGTTDTTKDKSLKQTYTTREELFTIVGKTPDRTFDVVNENALRKEFCIHPRFTHRYGLDLKQPLRAQIDFAIREHVMEDVKTIAEHIDSLKVFDQCITHAIMRERLDAVQILFPALARLKGTEKEKERVVGSMLSCAASFGNLKTFQWLLEKTKRPDVADEQGQPLLHQVVKDIYKTRLLLQQGVDPDQQDLAGKTALDNLDKALQKDEFKCRTLHLLLEAGAKNIPPRFLERAKACGLRSLANRLS